MLRVWPVLLVSGARFALTQFVTSNYISYSLTDVLSSLVSLILTISFLRIWKPAVDPKFAVNVDRVNEVSGKVSGAQGWAQWLIVAAVVIAWTIAKVFLIGDDPVLMAATNSSGGVMGKMISPQNIATGVATTELKGK